MISKFVRLAILGLSVVGVPSTLLRAQSLHSAKGCSNLSVHGRYGFIVNGVSNGNPITIVGQIATNGNGTIAGTETVSENGTISQGLSVLGLYKINPDCTGTAGIQGQGRAKQNFNLALTSGAQEMDMVETDAGTTEGATVQAQGPKACATALESTYGLQGTGVVVGVGPSTLAGQVNLHADGTLDGTETLSVNGSISKGLKISGIYKFSPQCFGGAVIKVGNIGPIHLDLQAVNGQQRILFIQTNANTLSSGSLQH